MPKKLSTNAKAQEVRDKREAKKQSEKVRKEQEEEDLYWQDDDKQINKKIQRKEEREAKHAEQIQKKNELKKLHDEEMSKLQGAKSTATKEAPSKLTQAQIAAARERLSAQMTELSQKKKQPEEPLLFNPNRVETDAAEARTVEDAIKVLRVTGDEAAAEKHPEKRLKATYLAYEERVLPELRKENPGMRLSQLKQIAYKNFQTAPENPKNLPHTDYNVK